MIEVSQRHWFRRDAEGTAPVLQRIKARLGLVYRKHVWSYDFASHRTDNGIRPLSRSMADKIALFRTRDNLDTHTLEYPAIRVKQKLNATEVMPDNLHKLCVLLAARV